jgi:hypothetical protein
LRAEEGFLLLRDPQRNELYLLAEVLGGAPSGCACRSTTASPAR